MTFGPSLTNMSSRGRYPAASTPELHLHNTANLSFPDFDTHSKFVWHDFPRHSTAS
jgi:hypothetical protein